MVCSKKVLGQLAFSSTVCEGRGALLASLMVAAGQTTRGNRDARQSRIAAGTVAFGEVWSTCLSRTAVADEDELEGRDLIGHCYVIKEGKQMI